MKVLYFGGQKSGKSKLAEQKTLIISQNKPYYIATYNNDYGDSEMQNRVEKHQLQRANDFITIEESKDLPKVIESGSTYLIDCVSMWLLNNLEEDELYLLSQIEQLAKSDTNIVFVLNDVSSGIIPIDSVSRKYIDLSGVIGQKLASICDEVHEVKLGIGIQLK
ncbi:bifunctional adenosylcobinamide kinase/adenosylcobinamide-phosphate guanylyltransferase [Arcobacteraceae bacterium]|nr:bifunctional adenosylcobinamide kinase/adenosylcobinamide-phosphate guanylyltransferase [Arcobacteraceae bacterium]